MRDINLEEHKKIQLNILLDFSNFCDEHGLKYFLAFGSLLGAVRHKGFIPWDDDIDIMMPKEDYDELISLFNYYITNKNIRLVHPYEEGSYLSYVKIIDTSTRKIEQGINYKKCQYLGVDIDIFPLTGQPDSLKDFEKWRLKLDKLYKKAFFKVNLLFNKRVKSAIKTIIINFFAPFSRNTYLKKAERLHDMYPYSKSTYVGCQEMYPSMKTDRYNKKWLDDFVYLDFEGYKFKAPLEYHKVLEALYGDYMTPPPLEQQVSHHSYRVFYLD